MVDHPQEHVVQEKEHDERNMDDMVSDNSDDADSEGCFKLEAGYQRHICSLFWQIRDPFFWPQPRLKESSWLIQERAFWSIPWGVTMTTNPAKVVETVIGKHTAQQLGR